MLYEDATHRQRNKEKIILVTMSVVITSHILPLFLMSLISNHFPCASSFPHSLLQKLRVPCKPRALTKESSVQYIWQMQLLQEVSL